MSADVDGMRSRAASWLAKAEADRATLDALLEGELSDEDRRLVKRAQSLVARQERAWQFAAEEIERLGRGKDRARRFKARKIIREADRIEAESAELRRQIMDAA